MRKSLFVGVSLLLVCTSIGYAQDDVDLIESATSYNIYDFDFVGGGTRAKGMGNAFLGVSNDITGGSWNPAGLFELDETAIAISFFKLNPKGLSTTQSLSDLIASEHSGSVSNISSINFVSPIRISGHPFVFTGNLTRNFNSFRQFGVQQTDSTEFYSFSPLIGLIVDTNQLVTDLQVHEEGGMNSINLGFGTRFYDKISFGATINIYSGHSVYKVNQMMQVEDYRYQTNQSFQYATLDSTIRVVDTNKFSGANITLGFKYNGEKLGAGLVIRTPFKLSEKRAQAIYFNSYINGASRTNDGILSTDILFKYEMPLMVGMGLAYQMNDKWLVAGDVDYRGFSGKKIDYRISQTINPGGSNIEDYITFDPRWNNSISFRIGTEYTNEFDFGKVPVRAGFGFVPVPTPSVDLVGNLSTSVNYNFTFGTGLHFEQIKFDVAYMYSTANLDVVEYGQFYSESKSKNHTLTFSFTGVF